MERSSIVESEDRYVAPFTRRPPVSRVKADLKSVWQRIVRVTDV